MTNCDLTKMCSLDSVSISGMGSDVRGGGRGGDEERKKKKKKVHLKAFKDVKQQYNSVTI